MKLSVIIPVYNSEATIESLVVKLQLELKDISFEIVMISDGSSDGSNKICTRLSSQFSNVKFISLTKELWRIQCRNVRAKLGAGRILCHD